MEAYNGTIQNKDGKGGRVRWPPYHWLDSPDIKPTIEHFWRPIFDEKDVHLYNRFLCILRLSQQGLSSHAIGKTLHINNVSKYLSGDTMSLLTNLRSQDERLSQPLRDHRWIPTRLTNQGTLGDSWIQVPESPLAFDKLNSVIQSIEPRPIEFTLLRQHGFKSQTKLRHERTNLFGFFLGVVVGDAIKHVKSTHKFASRSVSLMLSHNKPNSLRFGEFTTICANAALDLGMHRLNDLPPSTHRKSKAGCYLWSTAASPVISWIFNECIGLKNGETTTYNSVRMEWLRGSPRDFVVHFIQGLAESDGWTDAAADRVLVVSSPNTPLVKGLLENLGCPSRVNYGNGVEVLVCKTEDAISLPFFSPRIHSNLYENLDILAHAKRYPTKRGLPQRAIDLIREFAKTSETKSEVCLKLAKNIGYKVSGQTVKKYVTS